MTAPRFDFSIAATDGKARTGVIRMMRGDIRTPAFMPVGTAATVGRKLRQLAARLEVDELVVITWTHDPAAQMRSYELLAQEFALTANSVF